MTFDDIVGLNHIKKSLRNYNFEMPLMFEGEKGCGKTTLAYIIAKEFGASEANIREINCGFYTGIDNTRNEIELLQQSSLFGEKKVLILDEVHQLSQASQNAWLIPLQNKIKNILVIACTTTTKNLLDTFLRRFVRYKVQKLSKDNARELINRQNIELSNMAKKILINDTDGNPGIILSSLPKLKGLEDEDEIRYVLETTSLEQEDQDILEFFKKLLKIKQWISPIPNDLEKLLKIKTPEQIRSGILNLLAKRVTSNYFDGKNNNKIITYLYDSLKYSSYPEKANLVLSIYRALPSTTSPTRGEA